MIKTTDSEKRFGGRAWYNYVFGFVRDSPTDSSLEDGLISMSITGIITAINGVITYNPIISPMNGLTNG